MKPRPLTQYLFAKQYPTGSSFAEEAGKKAAEHVNEEGWIACVLDSSQERIILQWVPENEMQRGLEIYINRKY